MTDKYLNFSELQGREREGIDFRIISNFRNPSTTAIVAPHGGAIEPGTSELALAIADDDMNVAIFEGTKPHGNTSLHITSAKFDEPVCVNVVEQSSAVLTLHGEKSDDKSVYIGGTDSTLRNAIKKTLTTDGFKVCIHQNKKLQGLSSHNICNRGMSKKGVQLELAKGLRATFFSALDSKGRRSQTSEFSRFVRAVRQGLRDGGAL